MGGAATAQSPTATTPPTPAPAADLTDPNAGLPPNAHELLKKYEADVPRHLLPPAIQGLEVIEKLGDQVPLDLSFTNAQGEPIKLAELFNQDHKPVILALVYFRCPMQCPMILRNLQKRIGELDWTVGERFNVAVVSFDPSETPKAARERQIDAIVNYNRPHAEGLEKHWQFMTSSATNARTLAKAVGFPYRYLPDSGEYSHGAVIFVLTPDGRVSRYLYGLDFPADRLRMALLEASDGKIGSTWDRVMLWCFHFDPTANAYVLQAFRVMQIGGVLSAVAVGGLLAWMWKSDRRRRRRHTPALA